MNKNITTDSINQELHFILRQRREELGMTQKELAEKAEVREATISDFETGKSTVNSNIIRKIFAALLISISKTRSDLEEINEAVRHEAERAAEILVSKGYKEQTARGMPYEKMCTITDLPFVKNLGTIITDDYFFHYVDKKGGVTFSLKYEYFKTAVVFYVVYNRAKKINIQK